MFFSVVIPVYNAEAYLRVCVDSILNQTFPDFELILVDDGSTDRSGRICDTYGKSEERVSVIHQKNGGQARARASGLEKAAGQYVVNVDADDWLEPAMLESAAGIVKQYQVDIISYARRFEYGGGNARVVSEPVPEGYYDKRKARQEIYPRILMDDSLHNMAYAMGKVIARELLVKCQPKVNCKLRQGEDAALSVNLYAQAKSIYVSKTDMYHYRIAGQSVSNGFRLEMYGQIKQTVSDFETYSFQDIPDFQEQVHRYAMMVLFSIMLMAVDKGSGRDLGGIVTCMNDGCFRRHIRQARFRRITPKTRITFYLFRKNRIRTAYFFLRLCRMIKRGVEICRGKRW